MYGTQCIDLFCITNVSNGTPHTSPLCADTTALVMDVADMLPEEQCLRRPSGLDDNIVLTRDKWEALLIGSFNMKNNEHY